MDRRHFLGVAATGALGLAVYSALPEKPDRPEKTGYAGISSEERRRNRFLNVALTTHEGREVRFYDDLIKGKTVLLNVMYTVCAAEAICPLGTANLVEVQRLLGPRVGEDIFMYSITLDPVNDTPGVLKSYAKAFGVKPGWEFLTGEKDDHRTPAPQPGLREPRPGQGQGPVPAQRDAPLRDRAAGAVGRLPDPGPARVDRQVPCLDGARGSGPTDGRIK